MPNKSQVAASVCLMIAVGTVLLVVAFAILSGDVSGDLPKVPTGGFYAIRKSASVENAFEGTVIVPDDFDQEQPIMEGDFVAAEALCPKGHEWFRVTFDVPCTRATLHYYARGQRGKTSRTWFELHDKKTRFIGVQLIGLDKHKILDVLVTKLKQ